MSNEWSNGYWSVEQIDIDQIKITGPCQECVIDGEDFESVLSALAAAYVKGKGATDE